MPKVAIITDSTAYIPKELVAQYHIHVAPLILIWGEENFRDGVDIQPEEFYSRLKQTTLMPTTSQATIPTFQALFEKLIVEGDAVLAILISTKLSGTISSAQQARSAFPGAPIEIVDSRSAGMALGFTVLAAAKAAAQGVGLAECKALAEQAVKQSGVIFAVDTLEFLHRGGRIGGASHFFGTALNIKPILEVKAGQIDAVERVRTRKKSLARLLDLVQERIVGHKTIRLAVHHANVPAEAQEFLDKVIEKFQPMEYMLAPLSPVVGAHTGPGTLGLAYLVDM